MSEVGSRKPKRDLRRRISKPTHYLQPLYDNQQLNASYDRDVFFILMSAGIKRCGKEGRGHHVFLLSQPSSSMREIDEMVKRAFLTGAGRVSMEYVPVATAKAMKKNTALVVSLGERHTFVCPVIEGSLYPSAIQRSAVSAHLITTYLHHVLLDEQIPLSTAKFLKEQHAKICENFKLEEEEYRGKLLNVRTSIGTKESVSMHSLILCGEPYFRPKLLKMFKEQDSGASGPLDWDNGLHHLVIASINATPPQFHLQLYKNILIEGDGGKFTGLVDRLRLHLSSSLLRAEAHVTICPQYIAWRGAAELSSQLHNRSLTRSEFSSSSRSRSKALTRLYHSATPRNHNSTSLRSSFSLFSQTGLTDLASAPSSSPLSPPITHLEGIPTPGTSHTPQEPHSNDSNELFGNFASSSSNLDLHSHLPLSQSSSDLPHIPEQSPTQRGLQSDCTPISPPSSSLTPSDLAHIARSSSSTSQNANRAVPCTTQHNLPSSDYGSFHPSDMVAIGKLAEQELDEVAIAAANGLPPPRRVRRPSKQRKRHKSSSSSSSSSSSQAGRTTPTTAPIPIPTTSSKKAKRKSQKDKSSVREKDSDALPRAPTVTEREDPEGGTSPGLILATASFESASPSPTASASLSRKNSKRNSASSSKRRSVGHPSATASVEAVAASPSNPVASSSNSASQQATSPSAAPSQMTGKDLTGRINPQTNMTEYDVREATESEFDIISESALSMELSYKIRRREGRIGSELTGEEDDDDLLSSGSIMSSSQSISTSSNPPMRNFVTTAMRRTSDDMSDLSSSASLSFTTSASGGALASSTSGSVPQNKGLNLVTSETNSSISFDSPPIPARRVVSRANAGSKGFGHKKWKQRIADMEDSTTASSSSSPYTPTGQSPVRTGSVLDSKPIEHKTSPILARLALTLGSGSAGSSASLPSAGSSSTGDQPQQMSAMTSPSSPTTKTLPTELGPQSAPTSPDVMRPYAGSRKKDKRASQRSQTVPLGEDANLTSTDPLPPEATALLTRQETSTAAAVSQSRTNESGAETRGANASTQISSGSHPSSPSVGPIGTTGNVSAVSAARRGSASPTIRLASLPNLDSPDHIKSKPLLPPRPNLNMFELVTEFIHPLESCIRIYWAFTSKYFTPFVYHMLKDREFIEQYVIPRYQKFVFLKHNLDAEQAKNVHPDIFVEIAWQSHLFRPLQYRNYSIKHYNGRILPHELPSIRLAHELDRSELDTMHKLCKKTFNGESFVKNMPSEKMINQEVNVVVSSAPARDGLSSVTSSSSSSASPSVTPNLTTRSSASNLTPASSNATIITRSSDKEKITSSSASNSSTTNTTPHNSTSTSGSKRKVKKSTSSSSATAGAAGSGSATSSGATTTEQTVLTVKFPWKKEKDSVVTKSSHSSKTQSVTLPSLEFDLAKAIMEDMESHANWASSLRKASQGAFKRKNFSQNRTLFILMKSYEMFFYLLLKYGNKHNLPFFKAPAYIELISRSHMCSPQFYISDCRKYREHLIGVCPTEEAGNWARARKYLAGLCPRLPSSSAEFMNCIATLEFGGPIENVVRPCPSLPVEVLVKIFKKLPTRVVSHRIVCSQWSRAASMPDVWASYVAHDFPNSLPDVPTIPLLIKPFYLSLLQEELGDPIVFDMGASRVRCGVADDPITRRTSISADSSFIEESDNSGDGQETRSNTATANTSNAADLDDIRICAPRHIFQSTVRRAISKRR